MPLLFLDPLPVLTPVAATVLFLLVVLGVASSSSLTPNTRFDPLCPDATISDTVPMWVAMHKIEQQILSIPIEVVPGERQNMNWSIGICHHFTPAGSVCQGDGAVQMYNTPAACMEDFTKQSYPWEWDPNVTLKVLLASQKKGGYLTGGSRVDIVSGKDTERRKRRYGEGVLYTEYQSVISPSWGLRVFISCPPRPHTMTGTEAQTESGLRPSLTTTTLSSSSSRSSHYHWRPRDVRKLYPAAPIGGTVNHTSGAIVWDMSLYSELVCPPI